MNPTIVKPKIHSKIAISDRYSNNLAATLEEPGNKGIRILKQLNEEALLKMSTRHDEIVYTLPRMQHSTQILIRIRRKRTS